MSVSDEAVEAAAKGIFDIRDDPYDFEEWEDLDSTDRELYACQARAALEAAVPLICSGKHWVEAPEDDSGW